ncbi:MAG: ATP-dependent DNA ligase [Candidatus Methanomethylophilaceae archaeon]|jgi:DNA ligase-1|nr:ATP-dependent DNA ligase [Candidatus Methanomethylophilaceae archaeon]NLF33636.1 ATP-dependent DNA ligase [Thermoplasmatales archaeon]
MLFSELSEYFDRTESTSSRLEMTTVLAELFRKSTPEDLRHIIYLSQGKLRPDFCPEELGMADRLVLRAVSFTTGVPEEEVERLAVDTGDPGRVAEVLVAKKKQMTLFSEPLTLDRVLSGLRTIESSDGRESQERKMKHLANLLHDSGPLEARYLCRIVTGRMRVGAAAMTILDALAEAFSTKEDRPEIERAYNITCDLGLVGMTMASGGMDAVRGIGVKVGNPIKVMLAERLPSIAEVVAKMGGRCAMEYKYDGIRVQAHIGPDSVKLYSRRLEDLTSNFPDVAESLRSRFKGEEAIIEGECVAVDTSTGRMQPFQNVTHRRRKHGMDSAVKEYPVRMFMFDCLFADGEDLTVRPYLERRSRLAGVFDVSDGIGMSVMRVVGSPEEGADFFREALDAGCEGIMAKSVDEGSVYRAGSRGFLWIKYKKDYHSSMTDSFDLAVVGAFYGMGKRAGVYGALLMAAYDPDSGVFETVCKLGTGFDDAFLKNLPELLEDHRSTERPRSVTSKMVPDVWFEPAVVLEVVGAEISLSPIHTAAMGSVKEGSGLGIRFPRFTGRVREDKSPEQSTSTREIEEMYLLQGPSSEE